ncbi:hypothetical protein CYMTET_10141 [Cymbomonas tetramitiformis]|uniref:Uncharacterized protein n=1 Tax=Cymbomonas tetramitiformis TaxID=36881 RepID=A0AAE0GQ13_9CHLO|nr:hypothetical protein CYMTET_10141 [Cymbomonas tetramitiformis]
MSARHHWYYAWAWELLAEQCMQNPIQQAVKSASPDMPYLAEKPNVQEVIGVEGVREAITQFIHENSALKFDECAAETPGFETWRSSKITLVLGDFFDIQEHHIGLVDKIWDRAALVAVDPALREAYVDSMDRVLRPGGQILLVTFDRAAGSLNGSGQFRCLSSGVKTRQESSEDMVQ